MGQSVPYMQCSMCGTSQDPVTFLAKSTEQSLEAAAEILESRPLAFSGTDITPFLEQAKRTERWRLFFEKYRGGYRHMLQSNRLITDPRTDTSTLLYDRCRVSLVELLSDFPELRHRILIGKGYKKHVYVQMDYNVAAAPGRIVLMNAQGATLHEIILDHQTEADHLYVATPPEMLRMDWKTHMAIFNSAEAAEEIWDWMTEWLAKVGYKPAVVALTALSGRPDKVDIRRLTILPIGKQTVWAGSAFAPGYTNLRVCRLPINIHKVLNSAGDALYPLSNKSGWGQLPGVLQDFGRMSRELLDYGEVTSFREFLEETMSMDCLAPEEKRLAAESLSQHITPEQRKFMDLVMDEICDSPPLDMPKRTYTVHRGCYIRRRKSDGSETKVTNFRGRSLLRMQTVQPSLSLRHKSGAKIVTTLLRIITENGDRLHLTVSEKVMRNSRKLIEEIRNAAAKAGTRLPALYTSEPLLGQIIEGTCDKDIEYIDFPCLGFDHSTNTFSFPDITYGSIGVERRQFGCRETLASVYSDYMVPPHGKNTMEPLRAFVESHGEDERFRGPVSLAMAAACMFVFKASRLNTPYHMVISSPELLQLISKVGGLRTVKPEGKRAALRSPIPLNGIPVIMASPDDGNDNTFSFKISPRSQVGNQNPDLVIDREVLMDPEDLEAVPQTAISVFAEAALRAKSVEGLIRSALADFPLPFVNSVIASVNDLVVDSMTELEILLDFITTEEGQSFVTDCPQDGSKVLIHRNVIRECFNREDSHRWRRLSAALRSRLDGELSTERVRYPDGQRVRAWVVPRSFLDPNSNITQFA